MYKKSFFKLFFVAVFIVCLSLAGCFFIDRVLEENKSKFTQTAAAENVSIDVSTFSDFKQNAEKGTSKIRITNDIELTETIYFYGDTTVYVDNSYTLTRNANFLGDLFVVGCDKNGADPIVATGKASKLTLSANNGATLTIDGNKENVTGVVKGTAVMTVNTAEFNMYDGVVIKNHKKLDNEATFNYRVSYPEEVGGAAVIITSGSFNMYGGEITDCHTNTDEETTEVSSKGGAIYSFGQFNMYGGTISNCSAARGAALYNYKISKIFAGQILNNSTTVYGGAIYNPNSQYSNLTIGDYIGTTKVTIKGNTTEGSGGAIFSSIAASIFIAGDTEFIENTAGSNGGAINSPGANVIKNTVFKGNEAGSKGGAIYVYHNKAESTVRHTVLTNVTFEENVASSGGGALSSGSSAEDGEYAGSTVYVKNCKFNKNESKQGGAIYIIRHCTVELKNCEIKNNKTTENGGGVYVTGASNLTIDSCDISNNTATGNGGGIYSTTDAQSKILNTKILQNKGKGGGGIFATSNSSFTMDKSIVNNNQTTSGNGGGLYIYTTVVAKITNTEVSANKTTKLGGAIYASAKAKVELENIKANNNEAGEGGFLYLTTGETVVKIISGEALNNTAGADKGSTIWTNAASVVLQIKGTTTKQYFNYNGEILGKGEVVEYEA